MVCNVSNLERLEVLEAPELTPWSQQMHRCTDAPMHHPPWLSAQAGVGYRDHGRTHQCQWLYVPADKQVHQAFLMDEHLSSQNCAWVAASVASKDVHFSSKFTPFHQQTGMLRPRTSLGPAGKCTLTVRRSSMGSSSRHSTFGLKRNSLAIGKEWSKTDTTRNCWDACSEFFRPKHWYVRFNKHHQNQKVPVQLNPPNPSLPRHESLASPILVVAKMIGCP